MKMDNEFLKGIKAGLIFLIFINFIIMLLASYDHTPEEILSGNFIGDFMFNGNINFDNAIVNGFIASSNASEPGIIISYSGISSLSSGWLECNGSEISRTDYDDLFSVIGTIYGVGDGSTTFNLPDLRGEFIRGFDNGRGIDSGRVLGSFQNQQFQTHTHSISSNNAQLTQWVYSGNNVGNDRRVTYAGTLTIGNPNSGNHGAETRPRNLAMKYYIKT